MRLLNYECMECGHADEVFVAPPLPQIGTCKECPKCGEQEFKRVPSIPVVEAFIPFRDVRIDPYITFQSKEELRTFLASKDIDRPHPTMFGGEHQINRNHRKPRNKRGRPEKEPAKSVGG